MVSASMATGSEIRVVSSTVSMAVGPSELVDAMRFRDENRVERVSALSENRIL